MIVCKNKNCPYQQKDQCAKRVTVINEMGLCDFWVRAQQGKINLEEFIKKEVAVGEGEIVQIKSEDSVSQDAAQNENE